MMGERGVSNGGMNSFKMCRVSFANKKNNIIYNFHFINKFVKIIMVSQKIKPSVFMVGFSL